MKPFLLALVFLLLAPVAAMAMGIAQIEHQSKEAFLAQAFQQGEPKWQMLRLNKALKQQLKATLGHRYSASRIRYWRDQQRSAWIIDEIGKEQPITIGVVVENDHIEHVNILVYREERGGEVYQDFFTRQFHKLTLQQDRLSASIDGITGATLSVNAVTRVAKMALLLHQQVTAD